MNSLSFNKILWYVQLLLLRAFQSYCLLCNFVANMYVCGKNRENRLLQSKNSSSKSFVPVKFGNVSDAKFGPAHSVILKGNGQVLTSTANKKIDMDFFGAKESK